MVFGALLPLGAQRFAQLGLARLRLALHLEQILQVLVVARLVAVDRVQCVDLFLDNVRVLKHGVDHAKPWLLDNCLVALDLEGLGECTEETTQ